MSAAVDWKHDVITFWAAERGRLPLMPPTDKELRRLLDLGAAAHGALPCHSCGFSGKACGFCRRTVPGGKGLPE